MRPGGKSDGESPFFETPNLSFEGRVRNVAPPLTACDGASRCQARQLDSSTDLDSDLDRLTTDLDRAEPIRTSLFECPRHFGAKRSGWHGGAIFMRGIVRSVCSFVLFLT